MQDLMYTKCHWRFTLLILVRLLVLVSSAACDRAGVVEIDFSTKESIENAVDKGWLPDWLPSNVEDMRGTQETFDSNFIWVSLKVDSEISRIIQGSCEDRALTSFHFPSTSFMERFPAGVIEEFRRVSAGAMTYYACSNTRRIFFVAVDEAESAAYLWAD